MENQSLERRSIIKFLDLEGQSPSNIHERVAAVYGDSAPSRMMIFEWARHFNPFHSISPIWGSHFRMEFLLYLKVIRNQCKSLSIQN